MDDKAKGVVLAMACFAILVLGFRMGMDSAKDHILYCMKAGGLAQVCVQGFAEEVSK